MCIIVAKPAGTSIPLTETFDNCATSNKDGIGFAYNKTGEKPTITKGFKDVPMLLKMLEMHKVTKEHNLVIHFRLATHGKKDQGNCHPFPLSQSFEHMRELDCTCDCAVAHNGVFSSMPQSPEHSDTMKFVGGILASPEVINNLDSKPIKELVRGYCGFSSKLAFLRPQGITLIGDFELSDGVHYSNKQFESWGYRGGRHNWNEYCEIHKKYDVCYKKYEKEGKTYCYMHKVYDNCKWCTIHNKWDSCVYDKEIAEANDHLLVDDKGSSLLDLRSSCEWCSTKENVVYNADQKSYLCGECVLQLMSY